VSTVSTGMPGYDTPTGSFPILQKKVHHISNLYYVPMPFMQRLTDDGIALHAGRIPGYPASHGCIRLPPEFAKLLYAETKLGMTVTVQDEDQPGAPVDYAQTDGIGPDPALRAAGGYSGIEGAR
jgi:lipoprotein-anchoring transpeptidase ErfK/SrfK